MNNNGNNVINKRVSPLIFTKKVNNKHRIIPLNLTVNTLGPVRHFPPATKEWFNSIYAYNNNSIKNLSIADKSLSRLIKSYFNFYFSHKVLGSKRIATRFRRLSMNKIFVSKAELKHTSSKVIITLYVYNEEKRALKNKIKKLTSDLFPSDKILHYKKLLRKSRPFSFLEKNNLMVSDYINNSHLNWISNNINYYFKELLIERKNFSTIKKNTQKTDNLLKRENILKSLEAWIDASIYCTKSLLNFINIDRYYEKVHLRQVYLGKELKVIKYYKLLLNLNKSKFEGLFTSKLNSLISDIYNGKEIQLNIVNLKTLYFNSDIFTQAIALKLKDRNNRLLRVLKSALYLVKLPRVNRIREKYDKTIISQLWGNRIKNLKLNSLFNTYPQLINSKDILNKLLLNVFSDSSFKENNNITGANIKDTLLDLILNTLKHKSMGGVRLEAKGRLTRRFTASRSVFKIKWKGGLKNIDSSYRGLSSVILRGHLKSNVQYSVVNSKTRNGAFGLKGWTGNK
jgi:hypothetical protein